MSNQENKPNSKVTTALILFLIIGLIINTLLNYSQTSTIQSDEQRLGELPQLVKLSTDQSGQMKILLEKVSVLEDKLATLEKTCKAVK